MRLSASGPACASFAAVQAEIDGMILDNGTLTASNAIVTAGTQTSGGTQRYVQAVEITTEPDALSRIAPRAGQVLLVPRVSGSGYLQFLDPATGTITTSALAIPNYSGSSMYSSAVTLPNGKILLIPFQNTQFAEYDPWNDTIAATVTHGRTSTASVPAFSSGAVGRDGKVWLSPGHPTDKAISTYDYTMPAFAVTAMTLPYNTDWQSAENGGPVVPLPNGDLLFLTRRAVDIGAPWRVNPTAGTVTNCTRTSTTTTGATMVGGVLTPDAKHVILAESLSNKVRAYRLADNTLLDAAIFTNLATNPWAGITLLQDGTVALIGNGFLGFGKIDPVSFVTTMGTVAASQALTATANFADGETVTVASKTYTFKATLTNTNGYVQIGVDAATSLANLAAAISLGAGSGTAYAAAMSANADATATSSGTTLTASAITLGTAGNSLATTKSAANATWGGTTMAGGVNIGSTAGLTGASSSSGSNVIGGRMLSSGKVFVVPSTNLSNFFTWQPFTTGTVPEGVRKSRYFDRR
jgi:hypothetical protein